MSKRLVQVLKDYVAMKGLVGMARLCDSVTRSDTTVKRWLENGIPNQRVAYKLAVAAERTHEEALELSRECPSGSAKESA